MGSQEEISGWGGAVWTPNQAATILLLACDAVFGGYPLPLLPPFLLRSRERELKLQGGCREDQAAFKQKPRWDPKQGTAQLLKLEQQEWGRKKS